MKNQKGFTLIEGTLVIILLGIVAATVAPISGQPRLFQERFFVDQLLGTLRYAHTVAIATSSEMQLAYLNEKQLTLYMRPINSTQPFETPLLAPSLVENDAITLDIPTSLSLKTQLPIYIDANGKVFDKNHQWQETLQISMKNHHLILDGTTGFVYESR